MKRLVGWKNLGILALILTSACSYEKGYQNSMEELNIYQPSILKIKKGTKIQTIEGIYIPQTNEIWYSEKEFRNLERSIY
jgi:hypothetical protein